MDYISQLKQPTSKNKIYCCVNFQKWLKVCKNFCELAASLA